MSRPEFDTRPPPLRQAMLTRPLENGQIWQGPLAAQPSLPPGPPRPLLLFLHGSSGLNEQTQACQRWLAEALGLASLAPDSFARPDRPRYQSPAPMAQYEAVHALRLEEIRMALAALPLMPWVDARRLLLAGSSEGGVAVARWRGREFAGRLIYGWSCEDNYFVEQARNGFEADCALLNILSGDDPFFGAASRFNQGRGVDGDSRRALAGMPRAKLALLPQAPHPLYNLPEARALTADFLRELLA